MTTDSLEASTLRNQIDFWKFWAGQVISSFGSSFTGFALPLLIFKLTGSAINLSLSLAANLLPYLLFGLIIGAWVDRLNRKRLMIRADLLRACLIATLPLLALSGLLTIWWIYLIIFSGGIAIERTKNASLVYVWLGMLAFLIPLAFTFTPLGRMPPGPLPEKTS